MLEGCEYTKDRDPSVADNWSRAELLDEAFKPVVKGSAILVSPSEGIFRLDALSPFPEEISKVTTLIFASAIQLTIGNVKWKEDSLRFSVKLFRYE